jgi:peptidoglycan/LPS O-acetylase OafA/YrhL
MVSGERSSALDALRGIAIGQILLLHYLSYSMTIVPRGYDAILTRVISQMWSGVDLFFVLSGYLLGGILLYNRSSSYFFTAFYGRRCFRIMPLYVVLLMIYWFTGGRDLIRYLVFGQNFVTAYHGQWDMPMMLAVTWSLAVEEQFYLVLPVLIRWLPSRRIPIACIVAVLAAPVCRAVAVLGFGNRLAAYVLMPCRMDSLFLGVLAAWLVRETDLCARLQFSRLTAGVSIVALGSVMLLLTVANASNDTAEMQIIGYSYVALFYASLLIWIVATDWRPSSVWGQVLIALGIGAYSIYLFHYPMLMLAEHMIGIRRIVIMAAGVLTCGAAVMSWHLIERPLIECARSKFSYTTRLC